MKKFYFVLLGLISVCLGITAKENATTAYASFVYQGVEYEGLNGFAYVTSNTTISDSITIPAQVTDGTSWYQVDSIKAQAFKNNTQLTYIDIQAKIRAIGEEAFSGCTSLKTVKMPDYLQRLNSEAFENCTELRSIVIPEGVRYIGDAAFRQCLKLSDVTMPETTEKIGHSAFYNCRWLTTIKIPGRVKWIGGSAFASCTMLYSVICYAFNPPMINLSNAFDSSTYQNARLFVPEESEQDYYYDDVWFYFNRMKSLTGVKDKLVEVVGILYKLGDDNNAYVAYNETKKGSVVIPTSITVNGKTYPIVSTCDYAFAWNESITDIQFQGDVKSIGNCAFYRCSNLTSATFATQSLETIGEASFFNCGKLSAITFNEGFKRIEDNAFNGCNELKTLAFPASMEYIGELAFGDCYQLSSISCLALIPPTIENSNAFTEYTYYGCPLTVPNKVHSDYTQAYGWELFSRVLTGIDEIVPDNENKPGDLYNIQGILIKRNATEEDLNTLPSGIYILSGKKILVQRP